MAWFYGNSMEDMLSMQAVFTVRSIKQAMCNNYVVRMFMRGFVCRTDVQAKYDKASSVTLRLVNAKCVIFKDMCNQLKHCQVQINELHLYL